MRRYNIKDFELSQSYLFFWDKLEKANYFLEQIIDTVDEELEGRLVQELMSKPVQDGGQWDMAANLVEKYGLVGDTFPHADASHAPRRPSPNLLELGADVYDRYHNISTPTLTMP